jgi:hypothetical protein
MFSSKVSTFLALTFRSLTRIVLSLWATLGTCHFSNIVSQSSLAPVAHACNPSYSGGRDQEDHGSKPAPGK